MKKFWMLTAGIVCLGATMAICQEAKPVVEKPAAGKPVAKPVYWCEVCRKVSLTPGQCDGEKRTAAHILSIADGRCKLCACPADCSCAISVDNPSKCSCDKDVVTGNLTDLFFCEKDLTVSDKAGKCPVCAADLAEVKPKIASSAPPPAPTEAPKKHKGKTQ